MSNYVLDNIKTMICDTFGHKPPKIYDYIYSCPRCHRSVFYRDLKPNKEG
jgi:hypothetical protein